MLTAAVRDLHLCYPGLFKTDVRTSAPALWENSPYLTPLTEGRDVTVIDCHYPLIHSSNQNGRHFVTAFHSFLAERIGIELSLQRFGGDVHLSIEERTTRPRAVEVLGGAPYWLVVSGGKFDFTAKWWPRENYQAVVDSLLGKVTFVQVGASEHYHPRLKNVLDLRGRTSLRDLVRILYWCEGVLCPVTMLMHLSAGVPVNPLVRNRLRPCVVPAGGREPPSWESYPGHQFLHTIGALDCCAFGGCWRSRTVPLHDRSEQDNNLCLRPVNGAPACMRMIGPDRVLDAINLYLSP